MIFPTLYAKKVKLITKSAILNQTGSRFFFQNAFISKIACIDVFFICTKFHACTINNSFFSQIGLTIIDGVLFREAVGYWVSLITYSYYKLVSVWSNYYCFPLLRGKSVKQNLSVNHNISVPNFLFSTDKLAIR